MYFHDWHGGIVYLGDLLDSQKLSEFIDELKLFKANNPNIDMVKTDRSDELWISRDYFETITKRFDQIQDVSVSDKAGDIVNELTKYRYDVILKL